MDGEFVIRLSWLIVCMTMFNSGQLIITCDVDGTKLPCKNVTVHADRQFPWTRANEQCAKLHPGSRLVTIMDHATQQALEDFLGTNNGVYIGYWIGARLQFLNTWTWVDNTHYGENTRIAFSTEPGGVRGYATVSRSCNSESCHLGVDPVPAYGATTKRALCQCRSSTDVGECYGGQRYVTRVAHDCYNARALCSGLNNTDVAVLTADDVKDEDILKLLQENTSYYVGLSNVRLMWNSPGSSIEATYTKFADGVEMDKQTCVYIDKDNNWVWRTYPCDQTLAIICEHELHSPTVTTTTTTDMMSSEVLTTTIKTTETADATSPPAIPPPGFMHAVLITLGVLIAVAVVVIICAVIYFCKRSTIISSQQGYTRTIVRNNAVTDTNGTEAPYAALRPSTVPDVHSGPHSATRNDPLDQVGFPGVSKPRKTKPSDGELANKPAAAAATTLPHPDVAAGCAVYAHIVPAASSRQLNGVQNDEYENLTQPVIYASLDAK